MLENRSVTIQDILAKLETVAPLHSNFLREEFRVRDEALTFYAEEFNWHQFHEISCKERLCCHRDMGEVARAVKERN
jgi:hypothetical protein